MSCEKLADKETHNSELFQHIFLIRTFEFPPCGIFSSFFIHLYSLFTAVELITFFVCYFSPHRSSARSRLASQLSLSHQPSTLDVQNVGKAEGEKSLVISALDGNGNNKSNNDGNFAKQKQGNMIKIQKRGWKLRRN